SAHFDVVDARPEDWEADPYALSEQGGFFIGRGAADNKAGVAALLSTIHRLADARYRPQRTLIFVFIGDEETAQATTRAVVQHPWVAGAAFAINTDAGGGMLTPEGQPLIYLTQGAEKTYASFRLTVRNPGGHSSVLRSDNAVYDLARALLRIEEHRFAVMASALTRSYFAAVGQVQPGLIAVALRRFAADPSDAAALAAIRADPEYANKLATTCVATMVSAGHAENALPQRAEATVNCRIFPGTAVADVQAELAQAIGNSALTIEVMDAPQESPVSELTDEVANAITASVHARTPGVPVAPTLMAGATDGIYYRSSGIPTYGTSGMFEVPGEGHEHGLNERVRIASFYAGIEHIHDLALAFGR
ncbi:MAG: M20/M25/M40 family metallo-hydrolase, partial [Sphingopyxis sp.]